jgi:peptidoglycan/LPS O-acetylase OafA/YrhL
MNKTQPILPLTSLRFFFALSVFLGHIGFLVRDCDTCIDDGFLKTMHLSEGHLGVSFFFMLSGFILTYSYKDKLLTNKTSYRSFVLARLARIYPLHLITLLFAVLISFPYIQSYTEYLIKLITNLFLVQSFIPSKQYYLSFNSVSWSISAELFYYLLFPLLIVIINKRTKTIIALTISLPLLTLYLFPANLDSKWFLYIFPFFRIFDFIIGIIIFSVFLKFRNISINSFKITFIESSSLLLLFIFYWHRTSFCIESRWSLYYWIPMVFIILTFALQKGFISRVLSHKWLVYLGEISFSFYMIHQLVIKAMWAINLKTNLFTSGTTIILVTFILSLLLSILSFEYFEKPINEKIRSIING